MNMRILFLLVFFLLTQQVSVAQGENSVFWQMVSPNKKDTSYLFGTIHLLPKEKFSLPKEVEQTLKKCSVSYFELDLKAPQSEVLAASRLPEGQSLYDYVNQEQKDSLFAYAQAHMGIDSVMFSLAVAPFKPFIFTQMPMMKYLQNSVGFDDVLQKMAAENKLEIKALETHQEQIAFFDNMPNRLKTQSIMDVVHQKTNPEEELTKLQDNYLAQNTSSFLDDVKDDSEMSRYMYDNLIKKRNEAWVKRLKKELKGKKAFVAVGAAHLVGPDGLIALLEAEGFTIAPIKISLKP